MKIIHKYTLREAVGPYAVALLAFTLIILLQRLSKLADLVIAKGVPFTMLGKLVLSLFPAFLQISLPAALLLAVLLTLGRLGADSESTAIRTAGMGMLGMIFPFLLLALVTFAASLAISWSGIPWGNRATRDILARIVSLRAGAAAEEHVFREIAPGVLLFPDRVSASGTRMTGVFLSQQLPGRDSLLVFAKEGEFFPEGSEAAVKLRLFDGAIHHDDPVEGSYRIAFFRAMDFRIAVKPAEWAGTDDPKMLTLPGLWRMIGASDTARAADYRYHFHRRLSLSFSCLAFGLLAVPLGLTQRARGKSPAFALTMALILFYYVFLAAAGSIGPSASGIMVAVLWMPNAVVLAAALLILLRSEKRMVAPPAVLGRIMGRP